MSMEYFFKCDRCHKRVKLKKPQDRPKFYAAFSIYDNEKFDDKDKSKTYELCDSCVFVTESTITDFLNPHHE